MKNLFMGGLLLLALGFCGAMFYIPTAGAGYPKDATVAEYKANIQKNSELLIDELEAINQPTLEETLALYEPASADVDFYPTALFTIEAATNRFIEQDKLKLFQQWRMQRFLHKNYPNTYAFQREFVKDSQEAAKQGQYPKEFAAKAYTYKDGSVIFYNNDGMIVQYAQQ